MLATNVSYNRSVGSSFCAALAPDGTVSASSPYRVFASVAASAVPGGLAAVSLVGAQPELRREVLPGFLVYIVEVGFIRQLQMDTGCFRVDFDGHGFLLILAQDVGEQGLFDRLRFIGSGVRWRLWRGGSGFIGRPVVIPVQCIEPLEYTGEIVFVFVIVRRFKLTNSA